MIILNKSTLRIAAKWEHNHQEIADKKRARNLAHFNNQLYYSQLSKF